MAQQERTANNKKLVLRVLEQFGGCTQKQIGQHTQLTKNQVKTAIHDLMQAGKIFFKDGYYYPSSSRLTPFVTQRLWNEFLFDGVVL
jgi:predicted ArsR family transcriptional regulator